MKITTHFSLKKPEYADKIDVRVLSDNFEIIDNKLYEAMTEIDDVANSIPINLSDLNNDLDISGGAIIVDSLPTADIKLNTVYYVKHNDKYIPYIYQDSEWRPVGSSSTGEIFTITDPTTITVGGLPEGTTVTNMSTTEVLQSILFSYAMPGAELTSSPAVLNYKKGDTVDSIKVTVEATKKAKPIQSIKFFLDNTLVYTVPSDVSDGGTYVYTYNDLGLTSNAKLRVEVSDGNQITKKELEVKFSSKAYYGYIKSKVSIDEDVVKALDYNTLLNSKEFEFDDSFVINRRIVYAYDSTFGQLESIKDTNSLNYIDSFECLLINIDGMPYYVYVLENCITLDNFSFSFK